MNRNTTRKWSALGGLLAIAFAGCSPASLGWLLHDDKVPPTIPLALKGGKREVTVLVVTSQSAALGMDPLTAATSRDLASAIEAELMSGSAGTKAPIRVIDAAKFEKQKQNLTDWRASGVAALGQQAGADYVLEATINTFTLYAPQMAGELYSGRSEVMVSVYDVAKPDAAPQTYTHSSQQPERSNATMSPQAYRTDFVKRLGSEIAWKHVPHVSTDRIRGN